MTRFVLERVSDPDIEPVSLAEAKNNLRTFASATGEDTYISNKITAAREWVEDFTGRALIDQTWRLTVDRGGILTGDLISGFNGDLLTGWNRREFGYYFGAFQFLRDRSIALRKSPILLITSFVSVDASGVETAIDPASYELREANSKWPRIVPLAGATWSAGTFRITFRSGFADRTGSPIEDASVVPARFKQAILLYLEALYDLDPTSMPMLTKAAESLLRLERAELALA